MECDNSYYIVIKYGGYWNEVKGEGRMKYVGGNQKTLKFDRSHINLLLLKERIEGICQWIKGHIFDLFYHVSGTSPKMYLPINNDVDLMDMFIGYGVGKKVEVVVVVKDDHEYLAGRDDGHCADIQDLTTNDMIEKDSLVDGLFDGSFAVDVVENQMLCVGSRFESSSAFKQAIRSKAIVENFAMKIKSSDKLRFIAICSYRGCPWRIRASLCSNGHSFEVRRVHSTHLCPGINRAGNKHATSAWIASEIKEMVKRNPNITPKDIDMEKGLGEAIKIVFPNAEHRVCMRHLWKNIKKLFRCDDSHSLQKLVWTAANCFTIHEYNCKLQQILSISPEVHTYLSNMYCKWSKATFSCHVKNHYNTNNMAESFNSWVEEARNKPAVDLIDMIRGMLMEQRAHRRNVSNSWRGPLVPCVEEYIRDVTTRKEQFIIRHSTTSRAEVEGLNARHEVDIECRTCTCGFWQKSGLPCVHVAAFIGSTHNNMWHTYVDEKYYTYRYKMAYDGPISTLPGKEQWIIQNETVLPPITLRPRGRPKKRRFKNFLEGSQTNRNVHKCGRCNAWGHHRTTCKEPLQSTEQDLGERTLSKIPVRRAFNPNSPTRSSTQ